MSTCTGCYEVFTVTNGEVRKGCRVEVEGILSYVEVAVIEIVNVDENLHLSFPTDALLVSDTGALVVVETGVSSRVSDYCYGSIGGVTDSETFEFIDFPGVVIGFVENGSIFTAFADTQGFVHAVSMIAFVPRDEKFSITSTGSFRRNLVFNGKDLIGVD
jgi:hypothetical protein